MAAGQAKVPSSLVAIVAVSLIAAFGMTTQTVGDLSSVQGSLEIRHLSPDCARMLARASDLVKITFAEDDPNYLVARIPAKPLPGE